MTQAHHLHREALAATLLYDNDSLVLWHSTVKAPPEHRHVKRTPKILEPERKIHEFYHRTWCQRTSIHPPGTDGSDHTLADSAGEKATVIFSPVIAVLCDRL